MPLKIRKILQKEFLTFSMPPPPKYNFFFCRGGEGRGHSNKENISAYLITIATNCDPQISGVISGL